MAASLSRVAFSRRCVTQVVVVNLANPSKRVYFPCGQWLSDDDQLFRDLIGSTDPLARPKSKKITLRPFFRLKIYAQLPVSLIHRVM